MVTEGTLVYIIRRNSVLLAVKNNSFGSGKWNGFGGKIEPDESVRTAAIRETTEEIGIKPNLDEPLGRIRYHFPSGEGFNVTVFRTELFSGSPQASSEMKDPRWFNFNEIPYAQMWSGDELWLPYVFKNQPFTAEMWFDTDWKNIRHEIKLA